MTLLASVFGVTTARAQSTPSQGAKSEGQIPTALAARLTASCSTVKPQPESLSGAAVYVYAKSQRGRDLRLFVVTPSTRGPHPAIELFFGGGFQRGDVDDFLGQARALAALGYVAVLPDYSVFCRDGTTPLASIADGAKAYRWVFDNARRFDIDPRRVVLAGGSAGGGLALVDALKASAERKPVAVVLFNPSASLIPAAAAYKTTPEQAHSVSALDVPLKGAPPTLVFHGEADQVIPIQSSQELCSAMNAAGGRCRVVAYPGLNHGFFNSRTVAPAIGRSPYADTLEKMILFLEAEGFTGGKKPI